MNADTDSIQSITGACSKRYGITYNSSSILALVVYLKQDLCVGVKLLKLAVNKSHYL